MWLPFLTLILVFFNCTEFEPTIEEEECLKLGGDVLLPLDKGNEWSEVQHRYYRGQINDSSTDTFINKIEEIISINYDGENYDVGVQRRYNSEGQPSPLNKLYWNGPDGLYYMGSFAEGDTLLNKMLYLKYPVEVGDSWRYPRNFFDGRNTIVDSVQVSCVDINVLFETPADTFRCIVFQYTIRPQFDVLARWHYFTYFTPGVGQVGNLIYSTPYNEYNYNDRQIEDLKWKSAIFDYCIK